MTVTRYLLIIALLLVAAAADASSVKVLILDDVFQSVPPKGEKLDRMGQIAGDLLINGSHYQGEIEVWKGKEGLYLINELPLEEYIKHVVSAEVGQNWDMEALKAQAVISRTYALYQKTVSNGTQYDLTSSVLHQVYKGTAVDARIAYAVMNTEGQVLYHNGKLIEALYHSTCGGRTEEPSEVFGKSYPYLRPVESSCSVSPYAIWERKIPAEEIARALQVPGVAGVTITAHTTTGRVKTVKVTHEGGSLEIKANEFRKALGWSRLPSTNFQVSGQDDLFVFEGKGYGHGVGLCQWSALEMSREGKTYREILRYFYPGTEIRTYENR